MTASFALDSGAARTIQPGPSVPIMTAGATVASHPGRLRVIAPILIFDLVGPLVVYYAARAGGMSLVGSLVVSGVVPALGIALGVARHRRIDALGVLVLFGIVVGSVVGMVSDSARLVLLDGTVPTAVFGVCCLGSVRTRRPLIFSFAVEAMGADTQRGRDFADRWRYPGFRHAFKVITAVWGIAFLGEAAAQAIIIETASAGIAKLTSNVMPLVVGGVVIVWNVAYGRRARRAGERAASAGRVDPNPAAALESSGDVAPTGAAERA